MTRQMEPQQVREVLYGAAQLTFPSRKDEEGRVRPPRERIELLEDHYVECATARQGLEEAALWMQDAVKRLEDQWDAIEGWQTAMGAGEKTQKAIVAAKRTLKPDLYDGIREGKWLADKCRTQVKRLERDEDAVSRLYTMLGAG
jgi:hypothetical protein